MPRIKSNTIYILASFAVLAIVEYLLVTLIVPAGPLQIIRLTQLFSFTAATFLYLSFFTKNNYRVLLAAALLFAELHAFNAFFRQLGGVSGLGFLNSSFLLAVVLGFTSSVLLLIVLSIPKLRLVLYGIGILILAHALMLGSHLQDLSDPIPTVIFILISFLLLYKTSQLDCHFKTRYFSLVTISILSALFVMIRVDYFQPSIHSGHTTPPTSSHGSMDSDLSMSNVSMSGFYMPGMQGDKSKKFTASVSIPPNIEPNQTQSFSFKFYEASSGTPLLYLATPFEKPVHLIIISDDFSYYSHIHPQPSGTDGSYTINTSFPKAGFYRLYIDFQPLGSVEQQLAYSVTVGTPPKLEPVVAKTLLSVNTDAYQVMLSPQTTDGVIKAHITTKSGDPVTSLEPYLNSFGHMVLIREGSYDYLHAHSLMTRPPTVGEKSGPELTFMPMPLTGLVKPGNYHVYLQLNPEGKLITNHFVMSIK